MIFIHICIHIYVDEDIYIYISIAHCLLVWIQPPRKLLPAARPLPAVEAAVPAARHQPRARPRRPALDI